MDESRFLLYSILSEDAYLEHSGVKGQKRGVRRYQNSDGTLTAMGKIHYGRGSMKAGRKGKRAAKRDFKAQRKYLEKSSNAMTVWGESRAEKKFNKKNAKNQRKSDKFLNKYADGPNGKKVKSKYDRYYASKYQHLIRKYCRNPKTRNQYAASVLSKALDMTQAQTTINKINSHRRLASA